MTEKSLHRRPKSTNNEKPTENVTSNLIKKRKDKSVKCPIKPIYLLVLIVGLVGLYQILFAFVFVEYTNVPINVPKLVNGTDSDRFWGTYR